MKISNNYKDYDEHEEKQEIVETRQMLMMSVDGTDFAIEFEEVVEISGINQITPVPEFPKYVPGMVQVSDYAVPAIDARVRFGFEPLPISDRSCLVVAKDKDKKIGIIVDAVNRFTDTPVNLIQQPPKLNSEAFSPYITGIFPVEADKLCYIISPKLMYSLTEREAMLGKDDYVPKIPDTIEL